MIDRKKLNIDRATVIHCHTREQFLIIWELLGYKNHGFYLPTIDSSELNEQFQCINANCQSIDSPRYYKKLNFEIIDYHDFLYMIFENKQIKKIKIL